MTKAQQMARRHKEADPNLWGDLMSEVNVYFVFGDGSILSETDNQPCTFEMHDGKVRAVIFDEIKDSPEPE
jgi:hypothetical protein